MDRKFTMQDMANELGNTVAVMAASSFNLIGAGAYMFAIGVYVDNLKAADVTKSLNAAMETLGYNRSSKYALAGAATDVARDMVKRYGRPDAASPNAFWQGLADCATPADAIALVIADTKATHNCTTVQELHKGLKGEAAPKAEKSIADKVAKVMESATPDDWAGLATNAVAHVSPSDAKAVLLNLASKLTLEELNDVLGDLADMAQAMANARIKAEQAEQTMANARIEAEAAKAAKAA